jgi:ubiquinone/menaquinone biosynthesis C-methylase UbiE
MVELDEAKVRATTTYNAAADSYADKALGFWDRFGQRTVDRMNIDAGASILDVCSGAGASALPAGRRVLPDGRVLGIDLAENLLEIARERCRRELLDNVEFRVADIEAEPLEPESFDGVICVFGIFFLPDLVRALAKLWDCVRPGGELAITTWGPQFLEPANTAFWDSIRAERPELHKGFNPWDMITRPEALKDLMSEADINDCEIVAEEGRHAVVSPDDWWKIVLGTGYRGTIEQLDDQTRERVRKANIDWIEQHDVREVETNVVYAIARKGN